MCIRDRIYTYIGEVVVSVNPYRTLDIYNHEFVDGYRAREPFERPPHIYAIADSAFHDMRFFHNDSCIVISGEYEIMYVLIALISRDTINCPD